jgi:CTP-dependent riboflavin kinase
MRGDKVVKGRVFSGLGQGGYFTQLDWVKQQCQDKLGFTPYPGTLNLRVDSEHLDIIKQLGEQEGVAIIPPSADFCPAKGYRVSIGSIEAAIIAPDAEHYTDELHPSDVIEIIAPVNIKKALSIADGDELSLIIEMEAGQ